MNSLAVRENEVETEKTTTGRILSKAVADSICQKIEETGVAVPNYRETTHMEVYLRDEDGDIIPFPKLISVNTFQYWIKAKSRVPETGELFCVLIDKAREAWELKEEKRQRKELILQAKKGLAEIQKLPTMKDGKTVKHKKRSAVDGLGRISASEETETIVETGTFVESNRLKFDGYKFLLERLDPDFMPKQHDRMDVAILTLADLRRYKKEQDGEA